MKPITIRPPEPGETPLSAAEQAIAEQLRAHPTRRYSQPFAWRQLPYQPVRKIGPGEYA